MKISLSVLALSLALAGTTARANSQYLGNGIYETKLSPGEIFKGESERAFHFRQAFETCFKEQKGFVPQEMPGSASNAMTFQCKGAVDGKMAEQALHRRLLASEVRAETDAVSAEGQEPQPAAEASLPTVARSSYLNALGGALIGLTKDTETNFTVGGRIGGDLFTEGRSTFAIGLVGGYARDSDSFNQIKATAHYSYLMGEIFNRKAFGSGLYYGFRGGVAFTFLSVTDGSVSIDGHGSSFVWGPVVGYEFPAGSKVRANIDLALITMGNSSIKINNREFEIGSSTHLVLQAGVLFDI